MDFAVGLVLRSESSDLYHRQHGDVDCSQAVWVRFSLNKIPIPSICETKPVIWDRFPIAGVTATQITFEQYPTVGDDISLEFQFSRSPAKESVHFVAMNGKSLNESQLIFSGPRHSLSPSYPYFAIYKLGINKLNTSFAVQIQ